MKLVRSLGCVLGSVAFFLACSSSDVTSPTSAGLALTLSTDGSATPDRVSVKVSSASTVFYASEVALGTDPLPATLKIGASGVATVVVQAWSGATPIDRRDVTLSALPTDSFAEYTVVLSAKCSSHVSAAADGTITSDCASGTTCDPTTGACGSGNATATPTDACTPGATRCSSDGLSVETCGAAGAAWGTGVSCNGKTCAAGSCTACNVGDTSCGSTTCKAGDRRCGGTGRDIEECDAAGAWKRVDGCPYVCKAGACSGECLPGTVSCCEDNAGAAGTVQRCVPRIENCVGGAGCQADHPLAIYLSTCNPDGHFVTTQDCFAAGGNVGGAPGAETNNALCGQCETTNAPSCFKVETGMCLARP